MLKMKSIVRKAILQMRFFQSEITGSQPVGTPLVEKRSFFANGDVIVIFFNPSNQKLGATSVFSTTGRLLVFATYQKLILMASGLPFWSYRRHSDGLKKE